MAAGQDGLSRIVLNHPPRELRTRARNAQRTGYLSQDKAAADALDSSPVLNCAWFWVAQGWLDRKPVEEHERPLRSIELVFRTDAQAIGLSTKPPRQLNPTSFRCHRQRRRGRALDTVLASRWALHRRPDASR